jgi:hypothetical protein
MSNAMIPIRLVFADSGAFHDVVVHLPAHVLARYERIIDAFREDPQVTGAVFVDTKRLVAAYPGGGGGAPGPRGGGPPGRTERRRHR